MNKIYINYFKSKYGELILGSWKDELCICDWRYRKMRKSIDFRIKKGLSAEFVEADSEIIQDTQKQLSEYFEGKRKLFDLALKMIGTPFQQEVWQELLKIPFGETESYLGLSQKLGNEKAVRAVAAANGANAISIIIPCHRIIASNGDLTGYAGGIQTKRKLLQLEGYKKNTEKLQLFK